MARGQQHEHDAVCQYTEQYDVQVSDCGLIIDPSYCWLAASPDGLVFDPAEDEQGVPEVKFPFSARDLSVADLVKANPQSFLEFADGHVFLKHSHNYFFKFKGKWRLQSSHGVTLLFGCRMTSLLNVLALKKNFGEDMFGI